MVDQVVIVVQRLVNFLNLAVESKPGVRCSRTVLVAIRVGVLGTISIGVLGAISIGVWCSISIGLLLIRIIGVSTLVGVELVVIIVVIIISLIVSLHLHKQLFTYTHDTMEKAK